MGKEGMEWKEGGRHKKGQTAGRKYVNAWI
jgi:hypothetical protein